MNFFRKFSKISTKFRHYFIFFFKKSFNKKFIFKQTAEADDKQAIEFKEMVTNKSKLGIGISIAVLVVGTLILLTFIILIIRHRKRIGCKSKLWFNIKYVIIYFHFFSKISQNNRESKIKIIKADKNQCIQYWIQIFVIFIT